MACKFAWLSHPASGRETASGWNILRLQTNRLLPLTRRISGYRPTGFIFSGIHAVTLQVAIQTGSPDSQKLRRPQPVALAHLQHALNVHLAHLVERQRFPVVAFEGTRIPLLQLLR